MQTPRRFTVRVQFWVWGGSSSDHDSDHGFCRSAEAMKASVCVCVRVSACVCVHVCASMKINGTWKVCDRKNDELNR